MKAIGTIDYADGKGNLSARMFYNGKWQGSWVLTNKMPPDHPEFGVFEFEEADQFCKWIDPNAQNDLLQEVIDDRDEEGAVI